MSRPPFLKLRPRGERALLPGIDVLKQPVLQLPRPVVDAIVEELRGMKRRTMIYDQYQKKMVDPTVDHGPTHEVTIYGALGALKIRPGPLEFDYE